MFAVSAREGPSWAVGDRVDVVARVSMPEGHAFVAARGQTIGRVD